MFGRAVAAQALSKIRMALKASEKSDAEFAGVGLPGQHCRIHVVTGPLRERCIPAKAQNKLLTPLRSAR
jgi:hypothetical protein